MWDNIKWYSIYITGIPEEERENGAEETLEEIMTEIFSKLVTDIKPQT